MIPEIKTSYNTETDISTLLEDLSYKQHFIPKGFKTDFTSTEWFIRWVIPRFGRGNLAAVIHDYYYVTHEVSRKEADRVYRDVLIDCGFNKVNAYIRYFALRVVSGRYYG